MFSGTIILQKLGGVGIWSKTKGPWIVVWLTLQTLCVVSSGSPPLMRTPLCAPTPVPTITAVGVARPRAQGHAITRTEMACRKTSLMSYVQLEQERDELLLVLEKRPSIVKLVVLAVPLPVWQSCRERMVGENMDC